MEQNEKVRSSELTTWLILVGVFVAAILVTLFIGTRSGTGDAAGETTYPDLGDLTAADPNVPGADEVAPTFALETLDGGSFDLAAHIENDGRPVFLNLWASWCAPCRAEMPAINTAAARNPEVLFIGVAVKDDADAAAAFAEEIGVDYIIAVDDGTVEDDYPVLGLPGSFFINSDGTIAKNHFGLVTVDSIDDDIAELFGS